MRLKRKLFLTGCIACVALLLLWLSLQPHVEVHGNFSKQDVAELVRLGYAERKQDLIDWSATPPPWSIRHVAYRWKRLRFESAQAITINQKPDGTAEVTIGTGPSMRHHEFANTEQGWKLVTPKFE